jgi:hypothetical protein
LTEMCAWFLSRDLLAEQREFLLAPPSLVTK